MQIRILTKNDLEDVLDLFCECFSSDHYYQQLFANSDNISTVMQNSFRNSISFCLEKGVSVGMMDNGKLLGFALIFNYKETKDAQKEYFNEIFGVADGETLPYYEKIHRKIEINLGMLSELQQKYAHKIIEDIKNGTFELVQGRTFLQYIQEYQIKTRKQNIDAFSNMVGIHADDLLSLYTDTKKDSIDELRLENIENEADIEKVKAYYNVSAFAARMKLRKELKEYITTKQADKI